MISPDSKYSGLEYIGGSTRLPKTYRPNFFNEDQWIAAVFLMDMFVDWYTRNRAFIKDIEEDIMKYILNSFEPSEEVEEKGREIQQTGFPLRRPSKLEYMKTLMTAGFFPFELQEMGIHREISKEEEGEEFGLSGSLAILWDVSGSNYGSTNSLITADVLKYVPAEFHYSINYNKFSQFVINQMGVIYYLVSLAKKRGDYVSLIVTPYAMIGNRTEVDAKSGERRRVYVSPDDNSWKELRTLFIKYFNYVKSKVDYPYPDIMKILKKYKTDIEHIIFADGDAFWKWAINPKDFKKRLDRVKEAVSKLEIYLDKFPTKRENNMFFNFYLLLSKLTRLEKLIYHFKKVKGEDEETPTILFLNNRYFPSDEKGMNYTDTAVFKYWEKVLDRDLSFLASYNWYLDKTAKILYSPDEYNALPETIKRSHVFEKFSVYPYRRGDGIAYPYWIATKNYDEILDFVMNYEHIPSAGTESKQTYSRVYGTNDDWFASLALLYDNSDIISRGGKKPVLIIFTDMSSSVWYGEFRYIWEEMLKIFEIYVFVVYAEKHEPIYGTKAPLGTKLTFPDDGLPVHRFAAIATDSKEPIPFRVVVKGHVELGKGNNMKFTLDIRTKYFKEGDEIPLMKEISKKYGVDEGALRSGGLPIIIKSLEYYYYIKKPKEKPNLFLTVSFEEMREKIAPLNEVLRNGKINIVPVFADNLASSIVTHFLKKKTYVEFGEIVGL